jgi:anti-sigma B factor antagonist
MSIELCSPWASSPVIVTHLPLSGEVDMATLPVLEDTVRSLEWQGDGLLLDLSALTFIDSCGLREVVDAACRAARKGLRVDVVGASNGVKRLFEIAGLESLLGGSASLATVERFCSGGSLRA